MDCPLYMFVSGIDIGEVTFRVSILNTEILKASKVYMHSLRDQGEIVSMNTIADSTINYCNNFLIEELKKHKVYYVFIEDQPKNKKYFGRRNTAIQNALETSLNQSKCFRVIRVNPRSLKCYYSVFFGVPSSKEDKDDEYDTTNNNKEEDDDEDEEKPIKKRKKKKNKYRSNKMNAVKHGQDLFGSKMKKQLTLVNGINDHNVYDSIWIAKYGYQRIIMKTPKKDIKPYEFKNDKGTIDYYINSNNNKKIIDDQDEVIDLTKDHRKIEDV
jgi:hypothetical protein